MKPLLICPFCNHPLQIGKNVVTTGSLSIDIQQCQNINNQVCLNGFTQSVIRDLVNGQEHVDNFNFYFDDQIINVMYGANQFQIGNNPWVQGAINLDFSNKTLLFDQLKVFITFS